ncbi:hypothetical protein HAX54_036337, partial [Datura stramonium]|nr:hypothetical protein [Datura stramonium]
HFYGSMDALGSFSHLAYLQLDSIEKEEEVDMLKHVTGIGIFVGAQYFLPHQIRSSTASLVFNNDLEDKVDFKRGGLLLP